jgi:hypothetical protein
LLVKIKKEKLMFIEVISDLEDIGIYPEEKGLLKTNFYYSEEKAPPKDGSFIIGIFHNRDMINIAFAMWDKKEKTWKSGYYCYKKQLLVPYKNKCEYNFDPIIWTNTNL